MGVFIAQALTVLLGLALMVLSLALLALVAAARRERMLRPARLVFQPARGCIDRTNGSIRSAIDLGSAAPSRAPPPTFYPPAPPDPAEPSAGGPACAERQKTFLRL